MPSSTNVIYYNEGITYTNNVNVPDREILYIQNENFYNISSISMNAFVNATDLTSIYFYTDCFNCEYLTL